MHGPGGFDVEREARAPGPLGRLGLAAAPPSREISNCAIAVPCGVANGISKFQRGADGSIARRREIDLIRQRGHLQQRLPRDRAIGIVEQMLHAVSGGECAASVAGATGCAAGNAPLIGGGGTLVRANSLSPSRARMPATDGSSDSIMLPSNASRDGFPAVSDVASGPPAAPPATG